MSIWRYDAGSGDYMRDTSTDRVFDKKDIRDIFEVSNDDILEWVYEGLCCSTWNTRWADSLIIQVKESQLISFLKKHHPDLLKLLKR